MVETSLNNPNSSKCKLWEWQIPAIAINGTCPKISKGRAQTELCPHQYWQMFNFYNQRPTYMQFIRMHNNVYSNNCNFNIGYRKLGVANTNNPK